MTQLPSVYLPAVAKTGSYDAIDPLDARYYDEEVAMYLSGRSRIAYQAYVEGVLAYTLAQYGICSIEVAEEIMEATKLVTAEDVEKEEQITKHDIKALVNTIKSHIGESAQPFVHFGATSYDIVSTASALQLRDAMRKVVLPRLAKFIDTLAQLAEENADVVQIGRTHGQHGVPITFGFAIAGYVSRLQLSYERLSQLTDELYGKFSGAVGSYNALSLFVDDPLAFEKTLLGMVDLPPSPSSTQIVPAENTVRLLDEMSLTAGIMANLSHDMRHLQRTEIAEVQERFEKGQTGSSTMAHKRNPWNFENVVSMSKQVTAQIVNARMNISSEHQRDLTDSASARFYAIIPASLASMTARLDKIMAKLEVNTEAMQKNLYLTGGAIAAEPLYLLLEKYGHTTAHELSKELAHEGLAKGITLAEAVQSNDEALGYWNKFTDQEKQIVTNPETYYTGRAKEKALEQVAAWRTSR